MIMTLIMGVKIKLDYQIIYNTLMELNIDGLIEKNGVFNFRCPLCGDSEVSSRKKRGYIIPQQEGRFYCHNCLQSLSFMEFVKRVNYFVFINLIKELKKNDYQQYDRSNTKKEINIKKQTIERKLTDRYVDLISIAELDNKNKIKQYVINRHIPEIHYNNMFYFKGNPYEYYCNTFHSVKYKDKADKRIEYEGVLVPFIDRNKNNVGFSIRVVDNPFLRFVNLMEHDGNFFFGEDDCNWNKPIIVVEGLFDKLSFKSSQVLAMLTANPKLNYIKNNAKNKVIYVFDNEYNNKSIIHSINRCIDNNMYVCIWDDVTTVKDMNDFFKINSNETDVLKYIIKNSYDGFEARLKLDKKIQKINNFYISP